ncbi:MarR family winged helix-turn-helix transcriptional regulator [Streptomyces sp. NBC_01230]|nr:MarR family winged helix-turn-helix transcriptional regulator [Streptomyces sp. NBC_01230]
MLAWLSDTPGSRLPMTELARHTGVSTSRLSHLVDRLENQGWVQRLTVCTDGRVHLAYPTETGLRVLEDATPSHAPVRAVQPPRSPRRRTVPPAPRQQRTPSAAHKANRRSWPHRTGEVIPVVWTHLTMDFVDPGRCRSLWHGPRSTVRSSGPTRSRCGGLRPAGGRSRTSRPI